MDNNYKRVFLSKLAYKFQKGELSAKEVKKIMTLIKENKEFGIINLILTTILKG